MTTTKAADGWDPQQYERFREERQQPFYDLLRMVHAKKGMRAVDLGCGSGELTRELHRQLKCTRTLGVDNSDAMLATSDEFVGPGLDFAHDDIAHFLARPAVKGAWDLVFSNAALQWVPNHAELFRGVVDALAPLGQLAVQVPANQDHPSHVVAREVAAEAPFADALLPSSGHGILDVEHYAELLHRFGCKNAHVRLQVYGHKLPSREAVVEWVKGTLLTEYKRRLPEELYESFVVRYREKLLERLPDDKPYFYAFKRILLVAEKG